MFLELPPLENDSLREPLNASAADTLRALQARTPARLVVGRAGAGYRTATQLQLREDHAVAVDAVHVEMDLVRDFGLEFVEPQRVVRGFHACRH